MQRGRDSRGDGSYRMRWAAIGAAVAVSLGAGGFGLVNASLSSGDSSVYVPITPCRLADTRAGSTVGARSTPLGPGETHTFTVRGANGNCSIPVSATAVVANVTVVNATSASFMTIWPADKSQPNASSLNYVAGQPPTPNAVTVALSADGRIRAFNERGSVNVIIDIAGFYQTATGTANRITNRQIAMLQWHQDPGRAATIAVGNGPRGVAFDGTSIWVANGASNSVSKIDPATNTVSATLAVGSSPRGVAFDGTSIWVTNSNSNNVSRINPATNTVTATVPVGTNPQWVAFDGSNIWVTNSTSSSVSKINPATNTVTATITANVNNPRGVAFDGTSIWVANLGSNSVARINPATNTVTHLVGGFVSPFGVASDGTSIWVTNVGSATVGRINPATNTVTTTIGVGSNPRAVAFDGTNIWVTNADSLTVSKINPATNTVTATVGVGNSPEGVAFDGTNIWVANEFANNVSKIIPF